MLNILLPIAGRGSRFAARYPEPKPLIPIHGVPMIELAIACLRPRRPHRFVFLAQRAHLEQPAVANVLRRAAPGCEIIGVDGVTEGALCTVLLAKQLIDTADALMIANCDQYVATDLERYLTCQDAAEADGLIMTFPASDPKWSYVKLDPRGHVSSVVEKQVVSNEATVGIYNFQRGSDFVRAGEAMIAKNIRVNGEFYVAPVYNELIAAGARIVAFNIGAEGMYGLGEPQDLEAFRSLPISQHAAAQARA